MIVIMWPKVINLKVEDVWGIMSLGRDELSFVTSLVYFSYNNKRELAKFLNITFNSEGGIFARKWVIC